MEQDFWGRGITFPFSVTNGQVSESEGEDLIYQSILIILGTSPGERVMKPDFGCGINELVFAPFNTFTTTLVAFHVKEALLKWEPRINVQEVTAAPDPDEGNRWNIKIDYVIKTSNAKRNLVYPFYLEGKK
jgi:phage baseplate assembly protein W